MSHYPHDDHLPVNDSLRRSMVGMLKLQGHFWKRAQQDFGYCIDATNVMPAGSMEQQEIPAYDDQPAEIVTMPTMCSRPGEYL